MNYRFRKLANIVGPKALAELRKAIGGKSVFICKRDAKIPERCEKLGAGWWLMRSPDLAVLLGCTLRAACYAQAWKRKQLGLPAYPRGRRKAK